MKARFAKICEPTSLRMCVLPFSQTEGILMAIADSPINRSPDMVLLVYFLQEYGVNHNGRWSPPLEFDDLNFTEVYKQFFKRFGDGRPFKRFYKSAQRLRDHMIKRKEEKRPLNRMYENILKEHVTLTRVGLWEYLKPFRIDDRSK
jgi:hypothetical protein